MHLKTASEARKALSDLQEHVKPYLDTGRPGPNMERIF